MEVSMEEYLEALLGQIRCKKAWPMIEEEMRGHILEQAEENQRQGMDEEEAMKAAVKDMGDPVEAGVSLDRVHRPKMAWGVMALMGIISVFSIVIQWILGRADASLGEGYALHHAGGVAAGYVAMLLVYRLDYSYIGRYVKRIAWIFCGVAFLFVFPLGTRVNGAKAWISLGGIGNISIIFPMYLFIPVYGALLYRHRGEGYRGIGKCILWMVPVVFLAFRIPCASLALMLFLIMAAMLSIAVGKGWFKIAKIRFLTAFWSIAVGVPAFFLLLCIRTGYLANYQTERIKFFLGMEGSYADYIREIIFQCIKSSRFIGNSGTETIGWIPEIGGDYLLIFLSSYCGIAVALLAGLLLLAVSAKAIQISFGQKNQLGMIMGCGCGLILEMMTVTGILRNFGLIPAAQVFFPFLSTGSSGIVVSYILVGIVLSIYRYQNLLPAGIRMEP